MSAPLYYTIINANRLKEDRRREKSRRVEARQALEEEWLASTRDKQRRLLEDLHSAKEHGIRLHQQCERYHRSADGVLISGRSMRSILR